MKVFVSSLIGGFEAERTAVKGAITTLRHEAVMAEGFGAQPNSPQVACLQGLRDSDLVILILGERYGDPQASGISATHEEYREAKGTKPILAFVHEGGTFDPQQRSFVQEVQEWEGGLFRQGYSDVEGLRTAVTRALHDYDLTAVRAPIDVESLKRQAIQRLPGNSRGYYSGNGASLDLAIVGGPTQQIIRAAVIESSSFADEVQQAGQFGTHRILDVAGGTARTVENDALVLRQDNGASIAVDEKAHILLRMPLDRREGQSRLGLDGSVIIEDVVAASLKSGLEFASQLLDDVDRTQHLSHLAIAASIANAEYRGWRTHAENAANPTGIELGANGADRAAVVIDCQRPGIRLTRSLILEELIVRLRRQWRAR